MKRFTDTEKWNNPRHHRFARTAISKKKREMVFARFDGRCGYCGFKPESLVIDHIVPIVRTAHLPAGARRNDHGNLMPACRPCNNFKGALSLEEFRSELSKQVARARASSVNFRNAERFGQLQILDKPITFLFERVEAARFQAIAGH